MARPDFMPSALLTGAVVAAVPDSGLGSATPSENYAVADLVEHVDGLSRGLQLTARKEEVAPSELRDGDGSLLRDGWRERIPRELEALARAWAAPSAWEGDTVQGGVALPAEQSGMFVLNEILVHGWEMARATGQAYEPDDVAVSACIDFLAAMPREDDNELFAPVVAVADDAPPIDRLVGLTGRDPAWSPLSRG